MKFNYTDMTQSQRMTLINMTITSRGDGTIDQNMAKELRMMAFKSHLREKRDKLMAEEQRRREESTEALYEVDIAKHGSFCMEVCSRDCDMVENTTLARYTSLAEFKADQEEAWEWAEGPITWTHISHEDAWRFEPSQRDLIMENEWWRWISLEYKL